MKGVPQVVLEEIEEMLKPEELCQHGPENHTFCLQICTESCHMHKTRWVSLSCYGMVNLESIILSFFVILGNILHLVASLIRIRLSSLGTQGVMACTRTAL